MTRPLGYSVERADDGRIALVHAERCWTCSGSGKVAHSWEVTCPDGCTFTASARPVSSLVRCRKCPGYWDSSEFNAVSVTGACWDCRGGEGMRCSATLFESERARALRDQLTAALGEASVVERVGAVLVAEGCDCACGHDFQDHDDDCIRCLGCRVEAALSPEVA